MTILLTGRLAHGNEDNVHIGTIIPNRRQSMLGTRAHRAWSGYGSNHRRSNHRIPWLILLGKNWLGNLDFQLRLSPRVLNATEI